ncbi:hypothetical protein GA0115256_132517, partial [Streptomyces sp. DconLS]
NNNNNGGGGNNNNNNNNGLNFTARGPVKAHSVPGLSVPRRCLSSGGS